MFRKADKDHDHNVGYADINIDVYPFCASGCTTCKSHINICGDISTSYTSNTIQNITSRYVMGEFKNKIVNLSNSNDPYQEINRIHGTTRELLKLFKKYDIQFQLFTKGGNRAMGDFDLYKPNDKFGTILSTNMESRSKYEPFTADSKSRIYAMQIAKSRAIYTIADLNPIISYKDTLQLIKESCKATKLYRILSDTIIFDDNGMTFMDFVDKAYTIIDNAGSSLYIEQK